MKELSQSRLFDRKNRDAWMKGSGGKNLTERAYDAAEKILSEHAPAPLPEDALNEMNRLLETYEAALS